MHGTGAAASYGDLLVTSLLVLVAVSVAAFVVVKLVGRFLATGGVRGAHLLDVVARVPLEPRRSLYVVEVAGKTLLVGTSEMGLSVLSELDGDEVRARAVPKQSFGELVRAAWGRRRSAHVGAQSMNDPAHEEAGSAAKVGWEPRPVTGPGSPSGSGVAAASAPAPAPAPALASASAPAPASASASDSASDSASAADSASGSGPASARRSASSGTSIEEP